MQLIMTIGGGERGVSGVRGVSCGDQKPQPGGAVHAALRHRTYVTGGKRYVQERGQRIKLSEKYCRLYI